MADLAIPEDDGDMEEYSPPSFPHPFAGSGNVGQNPWHSQQVWNQQFNAALHVHLPNQEDMRVAREVEEEASVRHRRVLEAVEERASEATRSELSEVEAYANSQHQSRIAYLMGQQVNQEFEL